jgi:transcriptional regulator with XRE-family HTH domain
MENIGDRVKKLLKNKGITAYELSEITGISQSTLSRIINKNTKPNIENSKLLSNYFNVTKEWLLTGDIKKEFNDNFLLEPNNKYGNEKIEGKENPSQIENDNDIMVVSRLAKMLDDAYQEIKSLRQELERAKKS